MTGCVWGRSAGSETSHRAGGESFLTTGAVQQGVGCCHWGNSSGEWLTFHWAPGWRGLEAGRRILGEAEEIAPMHILCIAKCHQNVITVLRVCTAALKADLAPHTDIFPKAHPPATVGPESRGHCSSFGVSPVSQSVDSNLVVLSVSTSRFQNSGDVGLLHCS